MTYPALNRHTAGSDGDERDGPVPNSAPSLQKPGLSPRKDTGYSHEDKHLGPPSTERWPHTRSQAAAPAHAHLPRGADSPGHEPSAKLRPAPRPEGF